MARKPKAAQDPLQDPARAETAADNVRAERKAKREARAAAEEARKGLMKKPGVNPHAAGQNTKFGIAASSSKATSFSRSIISRARGGRGR